MTLKKVLDILYAEKSKLNDERCKVEIELTKAVEGSLDTEIDLRAKRLSYNEQVWLVDDLIKQICNAN